MKSLRNLFENVEFTIYLDGEEYFTGSDKKTRTKYKSKGFIKDSEGKEVTLKRRVNGGKITDMKLSALDF